MQLGDLFQGRSRVPAKHAGREVRGIACDSRLVREGDVFVAVRGQGVDGHDFIEAAVRAGATALVGERAPGSGGVPAGLGAPYLRVGDSRDELGALCDAFYGRPSDRIPVVGVTGTKGKTTTTWILESLLRATGYLPALLGTVENRLATRTVPSRNTTPGCLDLHSWLFEHVEAGGTHAVVEVSSHAISQKRSAGVRFAGGVFTNLAPEHLDYHKTFEEYCDTKAKFFESLSESAFAVLSREDPSSQLIARRTRARIHWYSGDIQDGVEELRVTHEGLDFVWKGARVRSRLLGYHNLLNLLGSMTAAECLGVARADIAEAAAQAVAPPGRLEDVAASRPFRVVVDYAHTDGSLEAVLHALRPVTPGRLITIFGCGGDRDRTKRPRMGAVAESGSDQVIVTSDNPRSEAPRRILEDIRGGLTSPERAEFIEDRREAIGLGVRMACPGDTVLIAGKGHETYQEFADGRIDFDDREVAREFLHEKLPDPAL